MSIAQRHARMAIRRIMSLRYESTGSGHARKPMINFNSKSKSHDDKPGQPHPMAPSDVLQDFKSFGKRSSPKQQQQSSTSSSQQQQQASKPSSSSSSSPSSTKGLPAADFEEFFDMPKRYWTRPPMEDAEIEAIMSGGATNAL